MTAPRLRAFIRDPGELALASGTDQLPIFLGTSSTGSLTSPASYGRLADVEATLGMGTLVDVAAHFFALGGTTFRALRLGSTVAGTASPVVNSGAGATLTLTGSAHHHDLAVRVEALSSGLVGGGVQRIKYSLDNWDIEGIDRTDSVPLTVPTTGILPIPGTGIVLNFSGTMATGDVYTFETSAPFYTATEAAGATSLLQTPLAGDFTYMVYCGDHPTSASAANTLANAVEAQLNEFFQRLKYAGAFVGASKDTDDNVLTAFAASASDPPLLSVGYGGFFAVNSKSTMGRGFVRLREHEVAGTSAAFLAISTDPGRLGSGSLDRIVGIDYDLRTEGEALHDARISVGRTWDPAIAQGVYIARQKILSALGSDFVSWQAAAVMIAALRIATPIAMRYLLEGLRQTAALTLDARDNAIIKGDIDRGLTDGLLTPLNVRGIQGHVSAASATVSTTTQLPDLDITVRVRPLGYPDDITLTVMFAREA